MSKSVELPELPGKKTYGIEQNIGKYTGEFGEKNPEKQVIATTKEELKNFKIELPEPLHEDGGFAFKKPPEEWGNPYEYNIDTSKEDEYS